jgi:hypothetical protein
MNARERLFAALKGGPTDRVPIWLLFPYHRTSYYADVRNEPSYRPVFEASKQYAIMLDRRNLHVSLFARVVQHRREVWSEGDERIERDLLEYRGRRLYAVGDDPDAAELAGVPVTRMLVTVYTLAGLICGFAGWVLIGRIGSVSPTSGEFANIESITAVVIGGMSLFGGRGSILGMIFGAMIVGVFGLGLRLYGADAQWTYLLIGILIIGAVAVDQWIRKVAG